MKTVISLLLLGSLVFAQPDDIYIYTPESGIFWLYWSTSDSTVFYVTDPDTVPFNLDMSKKDPTVFYVDDSDSIPLSSNILYLDRGDSFVKVGQEKCWDGYIIYQFYPFTEFKDRIIRDYKIYLTHEECLKFGKGEKMAYKKMTIGCSSKTDGIKESAYFKLLQESLLYKEINK